jgi:hypothetical protein
MTMTMGMTPMGPQTSDLVSRVKGAPVRRFGCIAARIGTDHIHKLHVDYRVAIKQARALGIDESAANVEELEELNKLRFKYRTAKAGMRVQMAIQDITRHPDLAHHAKWYCCHVHCQLQNKVWDSKDALLEGHEDNRILAQKEEVHVYYAAVEIPATPAMAAEPAQPAKLNDKGEVVRPARPARDAKDAEPAFVMLLSDES